VQLIWGTYYKPTNIIRSNAFLWPQAVYSSDDAGPLLVVPASFSNVVRTAVRFHSKEVWNVRTDYEWTSTQDPGYITDPVHQ
jgi:hypothetical protein